MENDLKNLPFDTIVITSIDTMREAFNLWNQETQERSRNDSMIDEAVVLKILHKSRATLWRWNKSGYLVCYKIGARNLYKQSDVEKILRGLKS